MYQSTIKNLKYMFAPMMKILLKTGEPAPNDSYISCMKNTQYKLKNGYNLSEKNLYHIGVTEITETKIDGFDFMQWAIMKCNIKNVIILTEFFNLRDYELFLKTLPQETQDIIWPVLEKSKT